MKFTDGYWLLREGVTAAHPVEVLDVTAQEGTLEIHAPTRRGPGRWPPGSGSRGPRRAPDFSPWS
ncbi:hypothetical protein AQI88_21030 [Streptomyces cellostaticus]|uniref:Glycoside hydrolase family 31 N-terminal domain-containing protein n=1 Tax=Streptomyces cellostaticus TaxID=67285 RepID=A0A101NK60_9ACTN|nr:hypothetical protein [Streptomyces cellostaticus]KUM94665.1 hypothetical protein AQI88_21030 [Streptomyces cellostaticus]GHI07303.1 hypothetical protein Scel_56240 [Streptomyces cellostaticus]